MPTSAVFVRKPLWHKGAILYEVHVKSFCDASGSGRGDLRGLIAKLDYIRDLGVTAIWVLPFYPSPQRDDGYDISDYMAVHPAYGTLDDFRLLVDEAHARGLYVITELVLNHTSDQHPWFQRARRAPKGSPERDFYVWSDSQEKYREARIIFRDFEPSNWSWDPIADAYYWHRFYAHQPDLNYDNPDVHAAMFGAVDFWMGLGVDGLRLDAVPYLFEREGTSCENLPETHAFLRRLSAHVREKFDHRMLLAEANQWPEDAVAYFGGGEACDMAFHFPLMPRLYMAVETADRFPILDILAQTPPIPDRSQWAIFLRNHDELTLEMVTDEERDSMYRAYARDERARVNLGIRRRLAPLMGGNRRKIELMMHLLLSLPGAPVLYYGDEIGMGDNIYLGDRDSVRTPMQWSPDRNAGFSRANAQKLYLPVVTDPEYHYETVNVENQERNVHSLLWWMRKRLHLRQASPALSEGGMSIVETDNTRILAFLREASEETLLVVVNLSQSAQAVRCHLTAYAGCEPVEVLGGAVFPKVGSSPYVLMLGPYETYWLRLRMTPFPEVTRQLPHLGACADAEGLFSGVLLETLTEKVLAPYVHMRWRDAAPEGFSSRLSVQDVWLSKPDGAGSSINGTAEEGDSGRWVALVLTTERSQEGEPSDSALFLAFVPGPFPEAFPPEAVLAAATVGGFSGYLVEGQHAPFARAAWMRLMGEPRRIRLRNGSLSLEGSPLDLPDHAEVEARLRYAPEGDSQALRLILPDAWAVRWFRSPKPGLDADMNMLAVLAGRFSPPVAPECRTRLRYLVPGRPPLLLGYTQGYVKADRDAATLAGEHAAQFLERALALPLPLFEAQAEAAAGLEREIIVESLVAEGMGGAWTEIVAHLGRQLGALHLVLADVGDDKAFAGESFTMLYQQGTYHGIRSLLRRQLARLAALPPSPRHDEALVIGELLVREADLLIALRRLTEAPIFLQRYRIHGDLTLEKILFTGRDFVFTGFDGEPWRHPGERQFKYCVLRDLAALLHALEGAACRQARQFQLRSNTYGDAMRWAYAWSDLGGRILADAYLQAMGASQALPTTRRAVRILVDAFRIERATHDLRASLNHPSGGDGFASVGALLRLARRARME